MDNINGTLEKLQKKLLVDSYAGYDPYDVLNSPLFKFPLLKTNKLIRFLSQQVFRRIPFNLRPVIGIKKEVNPVTLGLSIQAYTYLSASFPQNKEFYVNEIDRCITKLKQLSSMGYTGSCWGYNFDWEARYARINEYVPTVVATGIITNSLYENYRILNNTAAKELIIDVSNFVLKDLNIYESKDGICFSYSPYDTQKVINASLKGTRLLAQTYFLTKDEYLLNKIESSLKFVVDKQRTDGSWPYSVGDARTWSDNYHTAYVLDCLDDINLILQKDQLTKVIRKGCEFYANNFFLKDGTPKYYNNKIYPIDSTSGAQSILTLTRFGYDKKAQKVVNWMINNMYNPKGYFYYQKLRFYKHKTSYPRWSNAWMFAALSYYFYRLECGKD